MRRLQDMADTTVEGVDRCLFRSRSQCSPGKIGLEQHSYFFGFLHIHYCFAIFNPVPKRCMAHSLHQPFP